MVEAQFIIRPIRSSDLDDLYQFSQMVGSGFTSLPTDRDFLQAKIELSEVSFAEKNIPEARLFVLVLEDVINQRVVGLCGVEAQVGHRVPFYNYKLSTISQSCEALNIYAEHRVLHLVNDFQEASELVSLFLHPEYRSQGVGQYLSRSRLLLLACYPKWFGETVITEIRGISELSGDCPFWEGLGRHFFKMDFAKADKLTVTHGKGFIAELMPREPIYVDLLPDAAIEVIGTPHPKAAAAKHMLETEGLMYQNYIDIFDGGPLLSTLRDNITTVKKSSRVKIKAIHETLKEGVMNLLASEHNKFTFTAAEIEFHETGEIVLKPAVAKLLKVDVGDEIVISKAKF